MSNFTAAERALNALTHINFFLMQKKRYKEFLFFYFLDRHLQRYKDTGVEA